MSLIQLHLKGISNTQTQTGSYAMILSELDGNRKLPIVIGGSEAQSIVIAMEENIRPIRPLTHDLFKNFIDRFDIILKQVIIHKLVDGIFYSSIIFERDAIEEIIDSRTSDAIALALRFDAPIFVYSNILEKAGVEISDKTFDFVKGEKSDKNKIKQPDNPHKKLSLSQLKRLLEKAIKEENYEDAAKIRDEIISRDK